MCIIELKSLYLLLYIGNSIYILSLVPHIYPRWRKWIQYTSEFKEYQCKVSAHFCTVTHLWKSTLEGWGGGTVDQEVGGEVHHHQ